jgi:hypothetical protein
MKVNKNRYLLGFSIVVLILALVRCIHPQIAADRQNHTLTTDTTKDPLAFSLGEKGDTSMQNSTIKSLSEQQSLGKDAPPSRFFDRNGNLVKHRIYSVQNFGRAFPDQNDVQFIAAQKYGVNPVKNRNDAESRKKDLVYVGSNPYFFIDRLHSSIPYLIPRASILLQDIGKTFFDSLQIKGIPLHQIIVTSVMRSKDDVEKLRGHNSNATQNSCHLYGTTFDVCYNRYRTVQDPNGPEHRKVRNDTLKWVLSEVLNDMRLHNRCYVKYEVHQGCFHITVH